MKIDSDNLYPITDAYSNFSKLTKVADKKGYAIITKNSKASYVIFPYKELKKKEVFIDEDIEKIAQRLIKKIKEEYNIQLKLDLENQKS